MSSMTTPYPAEADLVLEGERCQDDVYRDCLARAEAGACTGQAGSDEPYAEARLALAECRQSCQVLILHRSYQLSDFKGNVGEQE